MPIINGKKTTAFPGLYVKSRDTVRDAVIQFDLVNTAPTTATGDYYLYVDTSGRLTYDNGTATTILGAAGAAATTWEGLYANDSTFALTGVWTLSQSSANPILTLNKTNVGAGAVIDITNSGTGKDIRNSTTWSLVVAGAVGVLELSSGGTINATDGALTIGKTGTATTFSGSCTVAEGLTVTASGLTVSSGALTVTSGNFVVTSGTLTVSAGVSSLIATSNAAATLLVTNNTVSTYGSGGTSTGMVLFRSTSLTTGTLARLQLTEATLNGGYYLDCWDVTAGAAVFSVAEDGLVVIAGTAAGTAALTLTLGDAVLSGGSLLVTRASNNDTVVVTNNSATSTNLLELSGSGVFTGTTTSAFLYVNPSGLTTGTGVYIACGAATTLSYAVDVTTSTTTGSALRLTTTGIQTGVGSALEIIADAATTPGAAVGEGVVKISADGLTTGTGFDLTSTSISLTSGVLLDVSHISGNITGTLNKTASLVSNISTRTVTTGTVADDFDLKSLVRTSIINGGGTFSSTGSVLFIQNVVTNTSGTVTDTANGVEIVMSANGTGDGVNITHSAVTGKALSITSSGTTAAGVMLATANSLTSGQILKLASSATAITGAGRIFLSSHTGATGTSAILNEFISSANDETIVLQVTAASLTSGSLLTLSGALVDTGKGIDMSNLNAVTTGVGIHVASTGTGLTSGSLLRLSTATTGAVATNGVVSIRATGVYTSTSNAGLLDILASATTAGTIVNVTSATLATGIGMLMTYNGLTTGNALSVSSSGTVTSGGTGIVVITGSGVTTGYLLNVTDGGSSNTLTSGVLGRFYSNSSDTTARGLVTIVNDNSAASGATPILIQQDGVVSTNYRRLIKESATGITIWMGNGTTGNGNLSGTAGDILINGGSNKPEYCTGTTNWTALV